MLLSEFAEPALFPLVPFDRAGEEPQRSEEQYCSAFKLKMGFDRNNPD